MNPRKPSAVWAAGGVALGMLILVAFFTPRTSSEWRLYLAVFAACTTGALWGSWRHR
ncbi:hypothetical protein [Nocardioides panacihumi]|uniref:hypothetical protein n=1 Tax=Nocardioides panacihumi TaxID=400774 RepID=UPI0031D170F2